MHNKNEKHRAKRVTKRIENPRVGGSIPSLGTLSPLRRSQAAVKTLKQVLEAKTPKQEAKALASARELFPRDVVAALREAWLANLRHCRGCGELFSSVKRTAQCRTCAMGLRN